MALAPISVTTYAMRQSYLINGVAGNSVTGTKGACRLRQTCTHAGEERGETGAMWAATRGTDAAGNVQPLEPYWTYQGMAQNRVQRIALTVA